ncbi:hypothetical protein Tco_0972304 [Tanacetum coccineum]
MPMTVGTHDDEVGSSRSKRPRQYKTVEEAMLPRVHHEFLLSGTSPRSAKTRYNTNLARLLPRKIYSPCIMDGGVLNAMGCAKEIEIMLEIKVYEIAGQEEIFNSEAWRRVFDINEPIYTKLCHEFYSTYEFDEVCADDELRTKNLIKFRLGGFDVYFQRGLRSDENINAGEYWLSMSRKEELQLLRSLVGTIRFPIFESATTDDHVWHQNGYVNVASLMARWLKRKGVGNATTLRVLIGSNGRLIVEDPAPGVLRVAMPRGPRPSIQDLYDQMGNMKIRQGVIEKMARRQSYLFDRYAGVFEYMAGQYHVPVRGAFAPLGYDEEEQDEN